MLQQNHDDYQSLNSPLLSVIKELHLKQYLYLSGFKKNKGPSPLSMLVDMINSIFLGSNLWRASVSSGKGLFNSSEQALYRFMSNIHFNWYLLCFYVGAYAMRNIRAFGKQSSNEDLCLIIDDSVIECPCTKKANNCTWTFDHNQMKSVKGYNCLQLSVTDGGSTLPLGAKLLASDEDDLIKKGKLKRKACSTPRAIKKKTDGRSHGAFLKKESTQSKPDLVLKMVKLAKKFIAGIGYVLMDSWFFYEPLLKEIKKKNLHGIGILKQDNRKYHRLNRKGQSVKYASIENLAATVKQRKFNDPHIIGCEVLVAQTQNETFAEGLKLKVVYLHHHTNAKKIIVIASTDTSLSAEKIVKLYARRWNIEVGFHIQKSFLGLNSECQSTDYDSQVAFANLSALRDILIEYKKRTEEDPRAAGVLFNSISECMREIPLAEAVDKLLDMVDNIPNELLKSGCIDKAHFQKAKEIVFKAIWKWYRQLNDYVLNFMQRCRSEIADLLLKVKKHKIRLKDAVPSISY